MTQAPNDDAEKNGPERERAARDVPSEVATRGPRVKTSAYQDTLMRNRLSERMFGGGGDPIRVGRFELLKVIGAGAMGVVHLAYDETLDRKVAIKLIHENRTLSDEAQARLLREAQAMARVSHANVIPLFEAGTYAGGVFVAMEYVRGSNLRGWIGRNKDKPWRSKLAVLLGAGRGLAAAHREGIIHRDFKPDNVMVTERVPGPVD